MIEEEMLALWTNEEINSNYGHQGSIFKTCPFDTRLRLWLRQ
jgi:hypothetical protein